MYIINIAYVKFACKAAANELKGLMGFYSCNINGLHYPMVRRLIIHILLADIIYQMALIDYKGFRIIAMTLLPIFSHTIRYGVVASAGQIYIHGSYQAPETVGNMFIKRLQS